MNQTLTKLPLIRLKSFSGGGMVYTVDRLGRTCTCLQFATEGHCKHLDEVGSYQPKHFTPRTHPTFSQALSGLVKSIRLRRTEDAVYWLIYLDGFPESEELTRKAARFRVARRILIASAEDGHSISVMEAVASTFKSLCRLDNGREGVDRVLTEPFDLVLMDIQMPVMDGLTATKLIRAEGRFGKLPILAMTAHAMGGDRERSLNAGMNDHITKPIDPNKLLGALIRWMPESHRGRPEPQVAPVKSSPEEDGLPRQLPPFDLQAALARIGKPKLLRKLMLGFCAQYEGAGSQLREYIANGRTEDAERLAHSLKSVAGMLEARDLAEAASSIEQSFRTGRLEGLSSLIDTFEEALVPAIAAANSLDRRMAASAEPLTQLQDLSPQCFGSSIGLCVLESNNLSNPS